LVIFEEWGGDPSGISVVKRTTGSICADVSEWQPSMKNWRAKDYEKAKIHLQCDHGRKITDIKFASFGTPQGSCGSYSEGGCHAHKSYGIFWKVKCCKWYSTGITCTYAIAFTRQLNFFLFLAELHWSRALWSKCGSRCIWWRSMSWDDEKGSC
jgi:hypothetical protein